MVEDKTDFFTFRTVTKEESYSALGVKQISWESDKNSSCRPLECQNGFTTVMSSFSCQFSDAME